MSRLKFEEGYGTGRRGETPLSSMPLTVKSDFLATLGVKKSLICTDLMAALMRNAISIYICLISAPNLLINAHGLETDGALLVQLVK